MLNEPMDAAMVRAIADIGHTLGLKTIAEFVENDAVFAALRARWGGLRPGIWRAEAVPALRARELPAVKTAQ